MFHGSEVVLQNTEESQEIPYNKPDSKTIVDC